jgi:uncharacterized protein (DUF433 family)
MNDLIEVNPKIMVGKPIIKGTRITVELVISSLADGSSYEEIQKEYLITKEQILASLKYAKGLINNILTFDMDKIAS